MEENSATKRTKVSSERKCITKRVSMEENSSATKKSKVSSQEFLPEEIHEQILVRLDVKDLIRFKSVCKSWKSLISRRHFIRAHQNHCFNNNDNGHTRISQVVIPLYSIYKPDQKYYIVGSANGLVCVNTFNGKEFTVANPWTREENMVQQPLASNLSCFGFGYDSHTDDYKIVFGVKEGMNRTSFQVLSLKSNVWKHIGYVNYICYSPGEIATLCNEALHWRMYGTNQKKAVIISLDLSKEVFKEIPQPDDSIYNPYKDGISCSPVLVGIKDECLCIWYRDLDDHPNTWIMQKYNVKESWVTLGRNFQWKFEFFNWKEIYNVKDEVENDISDIGRSTHDTWFLEKCMCVPTATVMQSLISPHPSRQ